MMTRYRSQANPAHRSRRSRGTRLLPGVTVLATALVAVLALPAGAAQASSNSGVDGCLSGSNYADPANDYLFASAQGASMDCAYVYVDIRHDGGAPTAWSEGWGYTSTSLVAPSASWHGPRSFHIGACCYGFLDRSLSLHFVH